MPEFIDAYVAAWRAHPQAGGPDGADAMARLLAVMTEDMRYVDVAAATVHVGHDQVAEMARAAYAFSHDLRFAIRSAQSDGARFAIEWEMEGTHTGGFGPGGRGTGRHFAVRGASVGDIGADGRASSHRDYWNLADFLEQVGITVAVAP
jgi:steroid delta-isomerase-like uncharacterized protein